MNLCQAQGSVVQMNLLSIESGYDFKLNKSDEFMFKTNDCDFKFHKSKFMIMWSNDLQHNLCNIELDS